MTVLDALLASWDRQCACLDNQASLFDDRLLEALPDPDGWSVAYHLKHVQDCRAYWLSQASGTKPEWATGTWQPFGPEWRPAMSLDEQRAALRVSQKAIADWVRQAVESGVTQCGAYEHPVYFLQHMVWHEGYHFGLINLALRRAGAEPSEEWEEEHVWGLWRTEIWP